MMFKIFAPIEQIKALDDIFEVLMIFFGGFENVIKFD